MTSKKAIGVLEEFVRNQGKISFEQDMDTGGIELFAAIPNNPMCPNWAYFGSNFKILAANILSGEKK